MYLNSFCNSASLISIFAFQSLFRVLTCYYDDFNFCSVKVHFMLSSWFSFLSFWTSSCQIFSFCLSILEFIPFFFFAVPVPLELYFWGDLEAVLLLSSAEIKFLGSGVDPRWVTVLFYFWLFLDFYFWFYSTISRQVSISLWSIPICLSFSFSRLIATEVSVLGTFWFDLLKMSLKSFEFLQSVILRRGSGESSNPLFREKEKSLAWSVLYDFDPWLTTKLLDFIWAV